MHLTLVHFLVVKVGKVNSTKVLLSFLTFYLGTLLEVNVKPNKGSRLQRQRRTTKSFTVRKEVRLDRVSDTL